MSWLRDRGGETKHLERIEALEKRLESLESAARLLKSEWIDTYDRLNRVMGRLNARIRKNKALEGSESDDQETPNTVAPPLSGTGTHDMLAMHRAQRRTR